MGHQLRLRRAERDDLDSIIEWLDDPGFLTFLHGDPEQAPKQLRDQLVAMVAQAPGALAASSAFYIIDSDEHGPIGLASFRFISWRNRSCRFDVYVTGASPGVNNGARALDCAVGYGFDEMNLHRLSRDVFADDEKTRRLMKEVGAKQDAVLPGHVLREGALVDVCRFGLLRPDFRPLTGAPTAAVGRGD